ncbi:hypothetical protein BJ741DRAFT_614201 [Chytriomyces cf. hyalinus JEL632]|nr:hypothetical protein BJ741DRAFT_614201 [Chytriomyces cf. hyalinus JEL632]
MKPSILTSERKGRRNGTPFFIPDNNLVRKPWNTGSSSSSTRPAFKTPPALSKRRLAVTSDSPSQRAATSRRRLTNTSNALVSNAEKGLKWTATGFEHLDGESNDAPESQPLEFPVNVILQTNSNSEDDRTTAGYNSQEEMMDMRSAEDAPGNVCKSGAASPVKVLVPSTSPHVIDDRPSETGQKRKRKAFGKDDFDSSLEICTVAKRSYPTNHARRSANDVYAEQHDNMDMAARSSATPRRKQTIQPAIPPPRTHAERSSQQHFSIPLEDDKDQSSAESDSSSEDVSTLFQPILSRLSASKSKSRQLRARICELEAELVLSKKHAEAAMKLQHLDETRVDAAVTIKQLQEQLQNKNQCIQSLEERLAHESQTNAFLSKRVTDVVRASQKQVEAGGMALGVGCTSTGRQLCESCKVTLW